MSNRPAALKAHTTNFVLIMLLIMLIGILVAGNAHQLVFFVGEHSALEKVADEVGHAMIVAAILGLTVDVFAKRRHEIMTEEISKKINTDVIGAIYGQQFPASIRDEVRRNFLEQRIHREDLRITYSFKPLPGHPDRLLVRERSSYKFVNTTDQAVPFDLRAYVECPVEAELRVYCKLEEASINDEQLGGDDLQGTYAESGMEFRWEHSVVIPPRGDVKFSSASQTVKYARDVETWASLYPSDGITLDVSLELELDVFAKCVNSGVFKQEVNEKHFKRWRLDNGVFPGQAVTFWWSPKAKPANLPQLPA